MKRHPDSASFGDPTHASYGNPIDAVAASRIYWPKGEMRKAGKARGPAWSAKRGVARRKAKAY